MTYRELSISGAWEITPEQHSDARGVFLEYFQGAPFAEAIGHRFDLHQANCSVSKPGVIRGIHYADVPPSQAKYVTCAHGAALDVVVDIRVGSPTYGQWEAVPLDDVGRHAVYVSEGLGHAFLALDDDTVAFYLCSAAYAPAREHGINALDPTLGIAWPTVDCQGRPLTLELSPKDLAAPTLAEAQHAGLLPSHDAWVAFIGTLAGANTAD
ncbi:MAG: dTDP-4-dehydrorhamnose 3,5-epimerase [Micrococcales bacterium]|nr:dTDP-4-dehydrorhamnose 3,5-epimerase [Micrococcales bacterium]